MIKSFTKDIVIFIVMVLLQVFILNNIQISSLINPYMYVLFVILLPFETPKWVLLISAFLLGLSVDAFSHTMGMHAAASTFMAFLRPSVLKVFSPRDGYESSTLPRIEYYGLAWFAQYVVILVSAHHFVLFYIEMFRLSDFFFTFFRVFLSTIFSSFLIVISQYFMFRR
jgi:rod shape-determining protein MreD